MEDRRLKKFIISGFNALVVGLGIFLLSWKFLQSLIAFIIVFFITFLSFNNNKDKKTDKGFELYYWSLSNRRKFIRTLWLCPFVLLVTASIWCFLSIESWRKLLTMLMLLGIYVVQLFYTYAKWKKNIVD
ncbi:hypothetical protein ABRT01_03165 [Lentibacillus sp. L22]|uniref:hypothetical protein n=1 Tax=Lentibacillus TaxID=175304 RepID=UPI0022B12602|nr:hypothetical protein [Lentibacillus daqui]